MFIKLTDTEWFQTTGDILQYVNIQEKYIGDFLQFISPYPITIEPNGFCKIRTGFKIETDDIMFLWLENDISKDYIATHYENELNNITLVIKSLIPTKEVCINTGDLIAIGKIMC